MADRVTNVAVLGSTGSIGCSALTVISELPQRLRAVAITANSNLSRAVQQARQVRPRYLVAADSAQADRFDWSDLPEETELLTGQEGLQKVVAAEEVDVVLSAIVGSAGLTGTLAAIEAGKTIALANKETLVTAGPLVMRAARERNVTILPVDSEHSAVFQALSAGGRDQVKRIVLTASGGPFLRHSSRQLAEVTVDQALAHPTWNMGKKITIDSATMMNKALEVIEARWLFDLPPERIDVVVHPQSIVHSMVEYIDGSVVAQMSPPDMKLPIQYALTWPDRLPSPAAKLDFSAGFQLDFEPPDPERFPAIPLGREVAEAGGTAGAVLNAANEAAVDRFLQGELGFSEIVPACRAIVEHHDYDPGPSLARLLELDAWARQEVTKWISV